MKKIVFLHSNDKNFAIIITITIEQNTPLLINLVLYAW